MTGLLSQELSVPLGINTKPDPSVKAEAAWPGTLEELSTFFVTPSPSWRRADSAPALCESEGVFSLEEQQECLRGGPAQLTGLAKYETVRGLESGSFGTISAVRLKQKGALWGNSRSCAILPSAEEEAEASTSGRARETETFALKTTDLRDVYVERLGRTPEFKPDAKRVKRAMTEFRVMMDLPSHTLFPKLVDVFTSRCDTLFHLVMEHVQGTDLRTRLDYSPKQRLPEAEARFFAAEMLLALDHLHSNGFLYRDLKPENVMVNETTGHIKLVDFDLVVRDCDAVTPLSLVVSPPAAAASCGGGSGNGRASPCSPLLVGGGCGVTGPFSFDDAAIAASECFGTPPLEILKDLSPRVSGRLKVPSSVAGTAEYIAPELLAGCPCSPASDRWQVGVVLHEMLFGVSPFRGSRPQTTFLLIATARVELPEAAEVSPAGRALVLGMLRRTGGWGVPSDPRIRLGGQSLREVQEHPFFEGIDWEALAAPGSKPPCEVPPCRNAKGEVVASLARGVEDW